MVVASGTGAASIEAGPAVTIGTDDKIYDFSAARDDNGTCGNVYAGNFDVAYSTNADSGASWTAGWSTPTYLSLASVVELSHWGAPMAGGNILTVQANGLSATDSGNLNNLLWSTWNGASWSAPANVLTSNLGTAVDANDWSGVRVSDADYRVVLRTGANRMHGQSSMALHGLLQVQRFQTKPVRMRAGSFSYPMEQYLALCHR